MVPTENTETKRGLWEETQRAAIISLFKTLKKGNYKDKLKAENSIQLYSFNITFLLINTVKFYRHKGVSIIYYNL